MKTKIFIAILMICVLFGCTHREAMVISANIGGEQEVPSVESLAFGSLYAVKGADSDFMQVQVTVSCIDSIMFSHFHHAEAEKNGPVIVTVYEGPIYSSPQKRFFVDLKITRDNFEGEAKDWDFDRFVSEILAGKIYCNIHTARVPSGEARGQLRKFR